VRLPQDRELGAFDRQETPGQLVAVHLLENLGNSAVQERLADDPADADERRRIEL
jgi:hypothetical protein